MAVVGTASLSLQRSRPLENDEHELGVSVKENAYSTEIYPAPYQPLTTSNSLNHLDRHHWTFLEM